MINLAINTNNYQQIRSPRFLDVCGECLKKTTPLALAIIGANAVTIGLVCLTPYFSAGYSASSIVFTNAVMCLIAAVSNLHIGMEVTRDYINARLQHQSFA